MYIVFEGPDGSGKGTALQKLAGDIFKWLKHEKIEGRNLHTIQQPGTTPIGEEVKKLIHRGFPKSKQAVFHLFAADHFQLQYEFGKTLEKARKNFFPIVLQDRHSAISAVPYQLVMNKMKFADYRAVYLEDGEKKYTFPNITLVLDVSVKGLRQRILERGEELDDFEKSKRFKNMVDSYKHIEENPSRILGAQFNVEHINAEKNREAVYDDILNVMWKYSPFKKDKKFVSLMDYLARDRSRLF